MTMDTFAVIRMKPYFIGDRALLFTHRGPVCMGGDH